MNSEQVEVPQREFTLDQTLFNEELYISILSFWLPSYPNPNSNFTYTDVRRWFATSTEVDDHVEKVASRAISSIGPEYLSLPTFSGYSEDRATSEVIAAQFLRCLKNPTAPESDKKVPSAFVALASIILLDQFPRNLFRGAEQPKVFTHYDRLARALTYQIQTLHLDRAECLVKSPVWRYWFYLPLEHSESLDDHQQFQQILNSMQEETREAGDKTGQAFVSKAKEFEDKHFYALEMFGRFPWRNKWLGRESTEAENAWLESADLGFVGG